MSDGNEGNRHKHRRGQCKWEAETGNLPYWEIKAKTALQALYQHKHWPLLSPEARYESELGVKGGLLNEASGDKKAQWMIQSQWSECVRCAVLACEAALNRTSPRTGRTDNGIDNRGPGPGDAKQSLDSGLPQASTKLKDERTQPCPKKPSVPKEFHREDQTLGSLHPMMNLMGVPWEERLLGLQRIVLSR